MLTSCGDYDQYYASLAASVDPSTRPTPGLSEFGEEEDVKPNVEYLDSLNEYRKRSRSRDDVGTGASTPKMPRTEEHMEIQEDAALPGAEVHVNGVNGDASAEDDPIVYGTSQHSMHAVTVLTPRPVNGEPVPFSQVTEEHQEAMTPEEYTAYFEVLTARS